MYNVAYGMVNQRAFNIESRCDIYSTLHAANDIFDIGLLLLRSNQYTVLTRIVIQKFT